MKKYFVFAAAALTAIASCSKVTPDVDVPQQEIDFQVAKYMASTKAGETAFDTDETFGTFAFYTTGNYADTKTSGSVFMDNQEIAYTTSDTKWRAKDAVYYWPKTGKLSFISYAPYVASNDKHYSAVPSFTAATNTFEVPTYTVEPVIATQVSDVTAASYDVNDLLYSTLVTDKTQNESTYGNTGVPTLFHHMLSKVNVAVKVATVPDESVYQYGVVVRKINFAGIKNKGSYSNANVANGATGTWTTSGEAVTPVVYAPATLKEYAADATFDAADAQTISTTAKTLVSDYYVMPQSFSSNADATITVEYDLYTLKAGKVVTKETILATTQNPAGTAGVYTTVKLQDMVNGTTPKDAWVENTIMTYTVTINPGSEILFDPAVAAWTEDSANSTINL